MNRQIVNHQAVPHERASATPDASSRPRRTGAAALLHVEHPDSGDPSLRGRQQWFARAIMTPESAPSAADAGEADRILTCGPRLSALDRLEIYRAGYHARLAECLADDYPVLRQALGEDTFDELCRLYIVTYPSDSPSLNYYGRRMPVLLRSGAGPSLPLRGFAADLSELEWALVEVIHAPSSPPLTVEGLGHIRVEAWPDARLVANTALRLLRFDYPVNRYFQAFRNGEAPAPPEPAESATVVYRSGPTLWRMDLTPPMHAALAGLVAGETLAEALSHAEAGIAGLSEEEVGQRVMGWFQDWVSSGLFSGVRA
jgi:hypothetical protein